MTVKVKRVIFCAVFAVKQQIVVFVGTDDIARKDDIFAVAYIWSNIIDCGFGRNVIYDFVAFNGFYNSVFAVHVFDFTRKRNVIQSNGRVANLIDARRSVGNLLHRVAVDGRNAAAVNGNDHGALVAYGAVHDKTAARAVRAVAVVRGRNIFAVARNRTVVESLISAFYVSAYRSLKRAVGKGRLMSAREIRAERGIGALKRTLFSGYGTSGPRAVFVNAAVVT